VVVAVVHEGGLTVEELPAGTTLLGLVQQRSLGLRTTQVLVNKQVESNPSAVLHTGDIVDLYSSAAEPAVSPLLLFPRGAASPAPPAGVLASRQAGRLPTMVQPGPAGSGKVGGCAVLGGWWSVCRLVQHLQHLLCALMYAVLLLQCPLGLALLLLPATLCNHHIKPAALALSSPPQPPMGAGRSNVVPLGALKVGRLRKNGSSS
jgi:hypothetical protein